MNNPSKHKTRTMMPLDFDFEGCNKDWASSSEPTGL